MVMIAAAVRSAAGSKPLLHQRNLEAPDAAVLRDDLAVPERSERGFVLRGRLAVFGAEACDVGPLSVRLALAVDELVEHHVARDNGAPRHFL